jgi:hypothetical protein
MGLLYLETLRAHGALKDLAPEYEQEFAHYQTIQETALRAAQLLNERRIAYTVYKTLKPSVSTNDVDILLLEDDKAGYQAAIDALLAAGYELIETAPLQAMFHDPRASLHDRSSLHKDPYDIDIYQEASASHIVYMRKSILLPHVTTRYVDGQPIHVLQTEAEVIVNLDHGVFPEQLYTLGDYHTALRYLAEGDETWSDRMWQVAKAGRSTRVTALFWQMTGVLHQKAHGFTPPQLEAILTRLTERSVELARLCENRYQSPHKYALPTIIRFLLEKAQDFDIARSYFRQAISMLNPSLASHVFREFIIRRQRESY